MGKTRTEDGRHSGLFSFIRRSSLGDKRPLPAAVSNVQQVAAPVDSAPLPVAPPTDSRQNHDEHRLLDLLKRVQNRQYDDQRGTSLTAFKEMPDFLRESNDNDIERLIAAEEFSEKCALDESHIEVSRHDEEDPGLHLSVLSPVQCLQQTAAFSDEDDIPSHENAERYFSGGSRDMQDSPDYSDPKLMERSLRDIGMASPASATRTWSLVGNVVDKPSAKQASDDFVFAVPTMPPLRIYRRQISAPRLVTDTDGRVPACGNSSERVTQCSADPAYQPLSVDTSIGQNELSGSSSTPSPTTHDLMLVDSNCIVAKSKEVCTVVQHQLAPVVDPEDSGEEFGIV